MSRDERSYLVQCIHCGESAYELEDSWIDCKNCGKVRNERYYDNIPDKPDPNCARCGGAGEVDSGGFDPQGNPVSVPCDCCP